MEVDNNDEEREEFPETYDIKFLPSEMHSLFADILGDASVSKVMDSIVEYVRHNVEPIGWKAIWYPSSSKYPPNLALFGSVVDVNPTNFEASVKFTRLLSPNVSDLQFEQFAEINKMITSMEFNRVPLIELKVVVEESAHIDTQFMYDNAVFIEQLSFFFKKIWRPYDQYDDNREHKLFLHECFAPRMRFAVAIKNKSIEKKFELLHNDLLKQSFEVKAKLENIDEKINKLCDEEENGDSDELDALQFIRLKRKLKDLDQKLRDIEDDFTRFIYDELYPEDGNVNEDKPTMHIVTKTFSLSNIKNSLNCIEEDENQKWNVCFHQTLAKAMNVSRAGDRIYLTKGTYETRVTWIEKPLEFFGLEDDVQLVCDQSIGDVFFFISTTGSVKFANITIRAQKPVKHMFVAQGCVLTLDQCLIDCNNMVTDSVFHCIDNALVCNLPSNQIVNSSTQ